MHDFQLVFVLKKIAQEGVYFRIERAVVSLDFEDIDDEYEFFDVYAAKLDEVYVTSDSQTAFKVDAEFVARL